MKETSSYQKVVTSLKRRTKGSAGMTVADVCAATALPLSSVRELLPKAADEYSGHLRVNQSGEILYHFPNGFFSRYRGLGAVFRRFFAKAAVYVKKALAFLFKVWIMVMLIGYFILFIALALASVFLLMAARSRSSNSSSGGGGGSFSAFNLFGLFWRLWFFSELTRPRHGYNYDFTRKPKEKKRPMHKAIFSFVFGDEDPNKNWSDQQNKAIISYLQANKGCIALAEYMAFTGENSIEAEKNILTFCSNYGGTPEVTEEGTIIYRFDELLLQGQKSAAEYKKELSPPIKRIKPFSANAKKMNGWFTAINAVNLLFGSYFLYHSFAAGSLQLMNELQMQTAPQFYAITYIIFSMAIPEPYMVIRVVLGFIPLIFSVLFWLIPALRFLTVSKDNEKIKLSNFKRFGFSRIFSSPNKVKQEFFKPSSDECKPKDLPFAAEQVIKDISVISSPEIEVDEKGNTFYSFKELDKEKTALGKYRAGVKEDRFEEVVFDSAG